LGHPSGTSSYIAYSKRIPTLFLKVSWRKGACPYRLLPIFLQPFYPLFLYRITILVYHGIPSSTFNKNKKCQKLLQKNNTKLAKISPKMILAFNITSNDIINNNITFYHVNAIEKL